MRAHGTLAEVPGADVSDHLCWVYDADDPAFDRAVRRFLAGGLERGERLLCVGERVLDSIRSSGDGFSGADELIASGALRTVTTAEAYALAGAFRAADQRVYYDAATQQALADGYRGLRVVAEVSPLAADPTTRAELLQWEHLADEYIAEGGGFTAMCAYRGSLPAEALADASAVHPLVHGDQPAFQIFFDDEAGAVLRGSVDTFSADRLARILATSPVDGDVAVLDLHAVDFVDVAGARVLARWARELDNRSIRLEVRGASALLRRMWRVLSLDELAPVHFSG
ncbi:UNVERIFIED_ORG: STAS domain-containing protein [Bacillus sp. AZ43]